MNPVQIYEQITAGRTRFLRLDELCRRVAEVFPGVLPDASALAAEAPRMLRDKQRLEIAQGEFLAAVLADPVAGSHLCQAMLLPLPAAQPRLVEFEREGRLDLGGAQLHREGKAAVVTMRNPRF